ncbi:hypothetical protein BX666DRAFT_720349 [Dichotomocladium elegans]|nr:hypothetical protein BX666DRAFT_720349 [Dichotomocladium elegans]
MQPLHIIYLRTHHPPAVRSFPFLAGLLFPVSYHFLSFRFCLSMYNPYGYSHIPQNQQQPQPPSSYNSHQYSSPSTTDSPVHQQSRRQPQTQSQPDRQYANGQLSDQMQATFSYMPQQQQQQQQQQAVGMHMPMKARYSDPNHNQHDQSKASQSDLEAAHVVDVTRSAMPIMFNNNGFSSVSLVFPDRKDRRKIGSPYHPADINSIVHSPAVSGHDLPNTLPPLNRSPGNNNINTSSNNKQQSQSRQPQQRQSHSHQEQQHQQQHPHQHQQHQQHPHHQHQPQQSNPSSRAELTARWDPALLRNAPQAQSDTDTPTTELNPYGCDVPGCYASFPASNGLFYHMKSAHPNIEGIEKPYRCAMPNCTKRYKNINGLQYHIREAKGTSGHPNLAAANGVDLEPKMQKTFKCPALGCKKAYRTANGLRYHQSHVHQTEPIPPRR